MQQQNLKSRFVLFLIVGIIIMILLVILLIVSKKVSRKAVDLLKASQIMASALAGLCGCAGTKRYYWKIIIRRL